MVAATVFAAAAPLLLGAAIYVAAAVAAPTSVEEDVPVGKPAAVQVDE